MGRQPLPFEGGVSWALALDLEGPIKKGCMAVNTAAELSTSDESAAPIVRDPNHRIKSERMQTGQFVGRIRR
jgi:hypothetical protein